MYKDNKRIPDYNVICVGCNNIIVAGWNWRDADAVAAEKAGAVHQPKLRGYFCGKCAGRG